VGIDLAIADADGASKRATSALAALQKPDGSWEGEVVWCPIITAQAVILKVVTGGEVSSEHRRLFLQQFWVTQRPGGGWGLHPEASSYRFVTTLVYVAARLLGEGPDHPVLAEARAFLNREPGGIFGLPQWGKVWLSLVGLYEPDGLNPCPPELFLLPSWLPFSPRRFYCHTRYIYLGMAFLVGSGFRAELGPISKTLIQELYGDTAPQDAVDHRHDLASTDVYVYPGLLLRALYDAVYHAGKVIKWIPGAKQLRRIALERCLDQIRFEQQQTNYQGLSPVNGILNCLALFSQDPSDPDAVASLRGLECWKWEDESEGIRYAGARSTTWDTSFALQAVLAGGPSLAMHSAEMLRNAYRCLANMQMVSEIAAGDHDRDRIFGGWCFSDGVHRWPVSDCAAEAIIALVDCNEVPGLITEADRLPASRLRAAGEFILSRQNADGGFGTYERRRGSGFLERLNPSEMFGQCMTELSYLECTASSIRALLRLLHSGAVEDVSRAEEAIDRGIAVILREQTSDGSWPGFWGINFIYGTHFALAALHDLRSSGRGSPRCDAAVSRAREWIEAKQNPDGGWGEDYRSCLTGRYAGSRTSLIAGTAWACLGLFHAEAAQCSAAARGIEFLLKRQDHHGGWPRDGVNGVFFGTAMLEYQLYNSYFPAMAVNQFASRHNGTN